ncbi:thioesterase family protein [Aureimonas sp. AU20]|uniref:acyl-CoA thioesterase n=1 Tax=Aureimonas sp. AU20 TaxID=1349819 RepID=UPI00078613AC|nr:thioesterase family protein [Aureimonas sp. AU20]
MPLTAIRTSVGWVPTVALSWLWGLGFFYSLHMARSYGWTGFLAFALPNALGLFLFGWVLGRRGRDPAALFSRLQGPFAGLFLLAQVAAVGISLHAFVSYLAPLGGTAGMALLAGLTLLVACATGQAFSLRVLRWAHAVYLPLGIGAALYALFALRGALPPLPEAVLGWDGRFFGLVVPSLVGFLLGPWTDVQQWQRVVEIHRSGGSPTLSYGLGSIMFLGLIGLNAALAMAAGIVPPLAFFDGSFGEQAAVATALAGAPNTLAAVAFVVWATIALLSTADSSYCALRWLLTSVTARSKSPLLAIVPAALVASPLWVLGAAVGLAALGVQSDLPMIYLMAPFATLFAGPAASLVARVLGRGGRYDSTLCYLIGLAALLLFALGYAGPVPSLMALSGLVGLVGALPVLLGEPKAAEVPLSTEGTGAAPRFTPLVPAQPVGHVAQLSAAHGFDGDWFVMRMTPTYDDTNSVGNVYFANYMRWVGKARELFFNLCMPEFSLADTSFYVLTRSFQHDFRREAQEFEPIVVRIRIASHNRKFVTLEHEIHSENHGLLGRGSQSLMFVDIKDYRPLDIPGSIIRGFLPYWPKGSSITDRVREAGPSLSDAVM